MVRVTDVSAGENVTDVKGQTVQGHCVRKYGTKEKNQQFTEEWKKIAK